MLDDSNTLNMKKLSLLILVIFTGLLILSCTKDNGNTANKELMGKLEAVTDSITDHSQVPGIVALVVDEKLGLDWSYTSGRSNLSYIQPMSFTNTFRIGSNTKTMTGTILLQMVDEGWLRLDDSLSYFFPEYPKAHQVTLRMLCNMTSGLFDYADDPLFIAEITANPAKGWSPAELAAIGMSHDFLFAPGTGFHYSSTNTILLGMVIEYATGNKLEEEITGRITLPLGLTSTGIVTEGTGLPGDHPHGYYAGTYVEGADYTEVFDQSSAWAAGAAYSTPKEMYEYVKALVGGGLLSDTLQHYRLTEFVTDPSDPNTAYGLCLMRRGSFFGHSGGTPGFTSLMYHSNDRQCTVVIYFNSQLPLVPDYLFKRYVDILYQGVY
jgi:D-alanyl-D-alanine carboxypeptidase